MKIGDLIRHRSQQTMAVVLDIYLTNTTQPGSDLEYRAEEYAKILFGDTARPCRAPLKLLKENWEIINES